MKSFDLNSMGVQEMNSSESNETNGGILGFVVGAILGGMLYQYLDDSAGCNNAMKEGFNEGYQIFK